MTLIRKIEILILLQELWVITPVIFSKHTKLARIWRYETLALSWLCLYLRKIYLLILTIGTHFLWNIQLTLFYTSTCSVLQYSYHTKIGEMISAESRRMAQLLVSKLQAVLSGLCGKLARYDEGTLFASFLSFTASNIKLVNQNFSGPYFKDLASTLLPSLCQDGSK